MIEALLFRLRADISGPHTWSTQGAVRAGRPDPPSNHQQSIPSSFGMKDAAHRSELETRSAFVRLTYALIRISNSY